MSINNTEIYIRYVQIIFELKTIVNKGYKYFASIRRLPTYYDTAF